MSIIKQTLDYLLFRHLGFGSLRIDLKRHLINFWCERWTCSFNFLQRGSSLDSGLMSAETDMIVVFNYLTIQIVDRVLLSYTHR